MAKASTPVVKGAPHLGPEPRKLDDGLADVIVQAIRSGGSVKDAAHYAGISDASLFIWLGYGRAARVEGIDTLYSGLLDRIEKARADCKLESLAIVRKAAADRVENGVRKPGQWQAAAWYLERRYPDEFGQRFKAVIGLDPSEAAGHVERLLATVFNDERLKLNKRQASMLPRILHDALADLEAAQAQTHPGDDLTPGAQRVLAATTR